MKFRYNDKVRISNKDSFYYGQLAHICDKETTTIFGAEQYTSYQLKLIDGDNRILWMPESSLELYV